MTFRKLLKHSLWSILILSACKSDTIPSPTATVQPSLQAIPTPIHATVVQPIIRLPAGTDGYPWWNDTVFYEIFVRSFADSDADGIGDFNGLIANLDYLNDGNPETTADLGITGIWLMPIHPSPSYHGYDVIDYYDVNPDYGTMEDFTRLLEEAHSRGIRIIIDLVLNHTSNQHPWFLDAQKVESPLRDWYLWSDSAQSAIGPWGQQLWHQSSGGFYYALFWSGMPDLNYENEDVGAEMMNVAAFWLNEIGVDGFRIDAARHLVDAGFISEHTDATHEWFEEFRIFYKAQHPEALTIGEIWDASVNVLPYIEGDEMDIAFDFDFAEAIFQSLNSKNIHPAATILSTDLALFPSNQFAVFLTNHDQVRTMSRLSSDIEEAKIAAAFFLTSPGVPFVYYGEEIGMVGRKPDENIRTPMQWSDEPFAGFSTTTPWNSVNVDYSDKNVAIQSDNPNSLLAWYRTLIHLRNQHAALRVGETVVLETGNNALFATLRMSQSEIIIVLINISADELSDYALTLTDFPMSDGEYAALNLLDDGRSVESMIVSGEEINDYVPQEVLGGYEVLVIQLISP